ncbi:MAG: lactate racemase domain-containing protein, partial [Spirochaetes bacterium]|nr:lactate racemase domain-containing protein [Spirochaetota bacterium]
MQIKIPYGKDYLIIDVPEHNVSAIIEPNDVPISPLPELMEQALTQPDHSPSFLDFINGDGEILFIVNDGSRPTPTAKVLKEIYPIIKDKNIRFIIATGVHRAPTPEEYSYIFGDLYEEWKS